MPHDPLAVARSYMAGRPFDETASTLVPDPAKSADTARLYEKLKHSPNNPKVRKAYDALIAETKAQFQHAQKNGMQFEPWTRGGQPYQNSDHMRADVRENAHLYYFPTDSGFGEHGTPDHPLMQVDKETGLRYNDMFRAVHDYFAHSVHPHQFGPRGEMRAWHEHAKMFSPLARLAMTAETHGQNSWVNFGPHKDKPMTERPYADQKATLMPVTQHPTKLALVNVSKWKVNGAEDADREGETPTKLARPTGLFGKLKGLFTGKPQPNRTEYDGIVHTGYKGGKIDPDGYAKVVAEKSAVAGALQRMGAFSQRTDPAKHREKVNLYTDVAAMLHRHDFPGLKPILDHYRKAANALNAPDVTNPQPDKPRPGEWPEPANRTHYTVPNIGPAGMDLTDAAVPLVRAIDRILAKTRPGHVPLDSATAPPEATLAGERELTKARTTVREPDEVTPTIPPGHGDKFAIGLADMRKFKKNLRAEKEPEPTPVPDSEKLPLVNYPGEIGPTGDRYFDLNKMLSNGMGRKDVLAHLQDKYALSPKNARAALARFLKHKSNINRTFKLARLRALRVRLGRVVDASKFKVNLRDSTDRGVLADHMAEEGDPREALLRGGIDHKDYGGGGTYQYRPNPRFQKLGEVDAGYVSKFHTFPDGSRLKGDWFTQIKQNPPKQHVVLRFQTPGAFYEDGALAKMTVPEFDDWIDSFPDDERARLRATFGERDEPAKRGKRKLARATVAKKDFTSGASEQIGGSRFAYHLAQIASEYKGTLLGKVAKYALTLKGRNHVSLDGRLAEVDPYARIGKLLQTEAMPVANDVHKKQEKLLRTFQPTGTAHEAFDKLTPEQKKQLGELDSTQTTPEKQAEAFRARALARHFTGAYNWHKIDDGLRLDHHVATFLKTNLKHDGDIDTLHTAAHRSYDLDRGAAKGRDPAMHDKFWAKLRAHVKAATGDSIKHEKLNESLARLADRAYERKEIGADTQKGRDPKPVQHPGPVGGATHGWRDAFGWLPGARHAKFNRRGWL